MMSFNWIRIPAGSHLIGCETGEPGEVPAVEVELRSFLAAERPVSNAEYERFRVATGRGLLPFAAEAELNAPDQPVVGVNWHDAVDYLAWLSEELGRACRLPTEAEREAASRGGLRSATWPWGDADPETREGLAEILELDRPHVPSPACANGHGLQCMADNVHEWCSDWYVEDLHVALAAGQLGGPETGKRRASRGGSWRHRVKVTPVAARSSLPPTYRYSDYGFRAYAELEDES